MSSIIPYFPNMEIIAILNCDQKIPFPVGLILELEKILGCCVQTGINFKNCGVIPSTLKCSRGFERAIQRGTSFFRSTLTAEAWLG